VVVADQNLVELLIEIVRFEQLLREEEADGIDFEEGHGTMDVVERFQQKFAYLASMKHTCEQV
jgi:hypothetical protein